MMGAPLSMQLPSQEVSGFLASYWMQEVISEYMTKKEKLLSTGLCHLEKKAVLRYVCVISAEPHLHLKVKKVPHSIAKFLTSRYLFNIIFQQQ